MFFPRRRPARPTIAPEAVRHQVEHRLADLRRLSYAALAVLPPWQSEAVPFGPRVVMVTTYREAGEDGALDIVVQCTPEGSASGFIWRGVYAHGFRIRPDGTATPLTDAERFAYM